MSHLHKTEHTGIEVIDDQHEQILEQLELLREVVRDGDRERCSQAVDKAFSLIIAHFGFEETLMEQVGYPFLRAHKRLHDYFLQRLAGYSQRIDSAEGAAPAIAAEMVEFATHWLSSHFSHEDRDYSPQLLADMQGLASVKASEDKGSWLSRTLRLIG